MVKLTYSKTAIQVVKKKVPPSLAALHKMARVEKVWNPGRKNELAMKILLGSWKHMHDKLWINLPTIKLGFPRWSTYVQTPYQVSSL